MKYLLDTNICIFIINRRSEKVLKRLARCQPGDIAISSIALAELRYGTAKSQAIEQNEVALNQFLIPLEIVQFDERAAASYGKVRVTLEKSGTPIGPLDTLIAAQALALDLTLVTNNKNEFERIKGLKVIDWST